MNFSIGVFEGPTSTLGNFVKSLRQSGQKIFHLIVFMVITSYNAHELNCENILKSVHVVPKTIGK